MSKPAASKKTPARAAVRQPHREHRSAGAADNVCGSFASSLRFHNASNHKPSHEGEQRIDDDNADEISGGDVANVQRQQEVLSKDR